MSWIYHLAPAARWRDWPEGQAYLPAEFAADGFVHCTAGEDVMLKVANAFYRAVPGEFVLLTIDPARLSAPLRWEPPADPAPNAGPPLAPLFPHVYGPLDRAAIVAVRAARRGEDGAFVGW